ncbi:hypothetical protein DPMN_083216 [Dreissena polymorpha]|uniref:Transmembrane protein n=1 Tax=Dreissena polymorpha TaxID=45954 RepID=A0A9D3Y8B9_DREPO|nr:hypothetical protein DPMN_083216 [Dreissena polymorpha]
MMMRKNAYDYNVIYDGDNNDGEEVMKVNLMMIVLMVMLILMMLKYDNHDVDDKDAYESDNGTDERRMY